MLARKRQCKHESANDKEDLNTKPTVTYGKVEPLPTGFEGDALRDWLAEEMNVGVVEKYGHDGDETEAVDLRHIVT